MRDRPQWNSVTLRRRLGFHLHWTPDPRAPGQYGQARPKSMEDLEDVVCSVEAVLPPPSRPQRDNSTPQTANKPRPDLNNPPACHHCPGRHWHRDKQCRPAYWRWCHVITLRKTLMKCFDSVVIPWRTQSQCFVAPLLKEGTQKSPSVAPKDFFTTT